MQQTKAIDFTIDKTYTLGEEIANSIIHGAGTCLSIAGLVVLVVLAAIYGDAWRIVSFSIYGSTLIILYLSSTLYHSFRPPRVKRFFKTVDHISIYLLIAGTYTPLLLVSMRGAWGWSLFGAIWGLALMGIVLKIIFINRYKKLSVLLYVFMGWLCLIAVNEILASLPLGGIVWLVAGGVLYTSGIIFYGWKRLPYNHAIWHLFVLGGSICHYFSILFYVLP